MSTAYVAASCIAESRKELTPAPAAACAVAAPVKLAACCTNTCPVPAGTHCRLSDVAVHCREEVTWAGFTFQF